MNYRLTTILADQLLVPAAAGTIVIPIRLNVPISRIAIKYEMKKSLTTMTDQAAADITRIELIDGSDVLHSTTGLQNQALCMFDRKTPAMNKGVSLINEWQESTYGIDFGRWLFDPELAFDPTKYSMPQLKITYNSLLSDTGATLPKLQVAAYVFDEKVISPIGFLMSKEHHSAMCPATALAHFYVDLPLDFPYRRIMLRSYLETWPPEYNISHVKIDEDNERRIPLDVNLEDYIEYSMARWVQVSEPACWTVTGDEQGYFFTPCSDMVAVLGLSTDIARHIALNRGRDSGHAHLHATNTTTLMGQTVGYCPNHCVDFEMGDVNDLTDWYDVSRVGDLRMKVTGGTGGITAAYQVVIQQLRRY